MRIRHGACGVAILLVSTARHRQGFWSFPTRAPAGCRNRSCPSLSGVCDHAPSSPLVKAWMPWPVSCLLVQQSPDFPVATLRDRGRHSRRHGTRAPYQRCDHPRSAPRFHSRSFAIRPKVSRMSLPTLADRVCRLALRGSHRSGPICTAASGSFQCALFAITLAAQPFVFGAPINVPLRVPNGPHGHRRAECFQAHRFKRDVPAQDDQIAP